MIGAHLTEESLARFVNGDLDDAPAAVLAAHLDACPTCAQRAAALDPLDDLFVGEPPPVPADLVQRIQRAAAHDPTPAREIAIGAALIAVATLLAVGVEGPSALAADLGAATGAVLTLTRGIGVVLASFQVWVALTTALALTGVVLTVQFAALLPGQRVRDRRGDAS